MKENKTECIRIRCTPTVKEEVKDIAERYGISMSEVMVLAFRQFKLREK